LFKDAGLSDDRVGILIVNVVNLVPSVGSGLLAARFGNRKMLLWGQLFMLACAVGLTVVLLLDVQALSIVFVSLYVAGFGVSLGPLAFIVASEVFPDELRASGGSMTLFTNWCGTLVIGVGYPYVADALKDFGFVPFILTIAFFTSFMFKCLPETSGKTTDEIQAMFRAKQ
jgi:MFS family permease